MNGPLGSIEILEQSARRVAMRRTTRETSVEIALDLDGTGAVDVRTGVGFFDHLLATLGHHAMFDLRVEATGDLDVDDHHTVEDTALVLGSAFAQALGDRAGIARFGDASVPMDDALGFASVDVGGRPYAAIDLPFRGDRIGGLALQNVEHALEAFARTGGITLHLRATGRNDHHLAEAACKSLARALRAAVAADARRTGVASTKGSLG